MGRGGNERTLDLTDKERNYYMDKNFEKEGLEWDKKMEEDKEEKEKER